MEDYSLSYNFNEFNKIFYDSQRKRVENPLPAELHFLLREMRMDVQCVFGDKVKVADVDRLEGEKMGGTNFEKVMDHVRSFVLQCGKKKVIVVISTDGKDENFSKYYEKSKPVWTSFRQWCEEQGVVLYVFFIVHEMLSLMAVNPVTCTQMASMLGASSVVYYLIPKIVQERNFKGFYEDSVLRVVVAKLKVDVDRILAKFELPGTIGTGSYRFAPLGTEISGAVQLSALPPQDVVIDVVKKVLLHYAMSGEYFDFNLFNDYVDQPTRKLIRYYMLNWKGKAAKRISDLTDIQNFVDLLDAMAKTHQAVDLERPYESTPFDFRRFSNRLTVKVPVPCEASLYNFTCLPAERSLVVPVPNSYSLSGVSEFIAAVKEARLASAQPDSEGCAFAQSIAAVLVPEELLQHGYYLPNKAALFAWACAVYDATGETVVFDVVAEGEKIMNPDLTSYRNALVLKDREAALRYAVKFNKAGTALKRLLKVKVLDGFDLEYLEQFAARFPKGKLKGTVTLTPKMEVTVDFGVQPRWTLVATQVTGLQAEEPQPNGPARLQLEWSNPGDRTVLVSVDVPPGGKKDKDKTLSIEVPVDPVFNRTFAAQVLKVNAAKLSAKAEREAADRKLVAEMEAASLAARAVSKLTALPSAPLAAAVTAYTVAATPGKTIGSLKASPRRPLPPATVLTASELGLIENLAFKLGIKSTLSPFTLMELYVENRAVELFRNKEHPDLRPEYLLEMLRLRWKGSEFMEKCLLDELMPHVDHFAACQDLVLSAFLAKCATKVNPGSWKVPLTVANDPMQQFPAFIRKKINGPEGFMTLAQTYFTADADVKKEGDSDFMSAGSKGDAETRAIKRAEEATRKRVTSPVSGC